MEHSPLSRREFTAALTSTILTWSLLDTMLKNDAFAAAVKPITDHWAIQLNTMSQDLKTHAISQTAWQDACQELFSKVNFEELLAFIDFDRVKKTFEYVETGAKQIHIPLPRIEGLPENVVYQKKIFGLRKDCAIIPHSHINMVSMHLVIQGEFELKHYDKVSDENSHLIVSPTIDRTAGTGTYSTISDDRDNIHWFRALSETAHTFDVVVDTLNPQYDFDLRLEFLDPRGAENLDSGLLRMKKLDYAEALQKYGKEIHH